MKNTMVLLGLVFWFSLNAEEAIEKATETQVAMESDPKALQLLSEVRNGLNGIHANFAQYELSKDNKKIDINTGQVWMQAPAQFRWLYVEPIEQLIVADGEKVWVYDEDLEQVTVKTQDNQLNPIYVIINGDLSQQHYSIKHEIEKQGIDWVSLTPKVANDEVKVVWLGVKNNLIEQIKVENNYSQTLVFEFYEIEKNPKFETGLFAFEPPAGVDVVQTVGDAIE